VRLSSRNAWQEFFQVRCAKPENAAPFFQIIDKLERESPEQSAKNLAALGFNLEEVNEFISQGRPTPELESIVSNLQARGLGAFAKIDYHVIRGLAYYTGVVFEVFDKKGEFRAIAGGGRYDNLIKLISGGKVELPALGFGMGDVVLLELLRARGLLPKTAASIDYFYLIEDETLREDSLRRVQHWRDQGNAVDYPLTPAKPDKQFKRALELQAGATLKLERTPAGTLVEKCKNLATRQEILLEL
jgi:histidyl-tRNA synthetase